MTNTVVSLICNPSARCIDDDILSRVKSLIGDHATVMATTTLAPNAAVEIQIDIHNDAAGSGPIFTQLVAKLRGMIADTPVDVNILSTDGRRKKLLIADMDSTIIQQECIDELADFAGRKSEIAAITEKAMRGELDFEAALLERVGMLKGLPESALEETVTHRLSLTPGAKTLVQRMHQSGAFTALVSGGFTFFTARVAKMVGFQTHHANELLLENGALTGDVTRPILGRDAKAAALDRLTDERGITPDDAIAVGDGANDLAMIEKAGLGVAFHAKPAVAAKADAAINHGDLTALLYLQGYRAEDFMAASRDG